MDDTIEKNGLVPTHLVLGILHQIPILYSEMSNQKDDFQDLKTAQAEINAINRRIWTALLMDVPPVADWSY